MRSFLLIAGMCALLCTTAMAERDSSYPKSDDFSPDVGWMEESTLLTINPFEVSYELQNTQCSMALVSLKNENPVFEPNVSVVGKWLTGGIAYITNSLSETYVDVDEGFLHYRPGWLSNTTNISTYISSNNTSRNPSCLIRYLRCSSEVQAI